MKLRTEIATAIELTLGAGTAAVLTFVYLAITARKLGPAAYADFASGITLIAVATVLLTPVAAAVSRVTARLAGRGENERVDALRALVLRRFTLGSLVGLAIAAAVAIPLARVFRFQSPITVWLAFACGLAFTILSIDRGFLLGRHRFRTQAINVVLEAIIRLVIVIAIYRVSATPHAALLAYLAALLIAEGLLLRNAKEETAAESDWRDVLALAGPLLLLMIGAAIFQNADMLAVKRWLPATTAGHYGAANAIARGFGVLFVPLFQMSGPLLIALHDAGRSIAAATLRLCGYYIALSSIPLLGLALYGRELMTLAYGPAYAAAGPIVVLLAGATVTSYLALLIAQAQVTIGHRAFARVYAIISIIQIAALAMFHASALQIIAALFAVQGAALVILLVMMARAHR